jgi:hypothetical protein
VCVRAHPAGSARVVRVCCGPPHVRQTLETSQLLRKEHTSAYVSIRQHTSRETSQHPTHSRSSSAPNPPHTHSALPRRPYAEAPAAAPAAAGTQFTCFTQYSYFCTSKTSKLSTCGSPCTQPPRAQRVRPYAALSHAPPHIGPHTSAYGAYVSIRQHTSALSHAPPPHIGPQDGRPRRGSVGDGLLMQMHVKRHNRDPICLGLATPRRTRPPPPSAPGI